MLQYQPAVTKNAFRDLGFCGRHVADVGTVAWPVASMVGMLKFGEPAPVDPPPRQRRVRRRGIAPEATSRQARRMADVRCIGRKRIQCRYDFAIGIHAAPDEPDDGIIRSESRKTPRLTAAEFRHDRAVSDSSRLRIIGWHEHSRRRARKAATGGELRRWLRFQPLQSAALVGLLAPRAPGGDER